MIAAVGGNITNLRVNFAGSRPATKLLAAAATWATVSSTNRRSTPLLPVAGVRSSPPTSAVASTTAFNEPPTHTASDEIPIASDAPPRLTSRGFLPWRFADAGPGVRRATVMGPASENLHNSRPQYLPGLSPLYLQKRTSQAPTGKSA
jgi:hypothetical protein